LIHAWLGRHWKSRGDLATALGEFEIAAFLAPDDPAVAAQLGEIYSDLGDLEAAEAAYRAAVDRAPTDPGFWLLLAQHSLGHEIEVDTLGIPSARQVVRLDPDFAAGWDALGFGHLLLGDTEVAGRLLHRALASDSSSAAAHYHLGLLFRVRQELDLAAAEWKACLVLDPEGPYGELARRALEGR
jgi:tetratricopeptide (TPR) repeat protein